MPTAHTENASLKTTLREQEKMRASWVVFMAIGLFAVMASFYERSEGFVISLNARRDQLKASRRKEKLEEEKIERRLRKLLNKKLEVERKLNHLRKWVKKYKSSHRSKVSLSTLEFVRESNKDPTSC